MTTIDTTLPTLAELRARKAASGGLPTLAELRARKAAGTLAPAGPDTTAPPAGPTLDDRLNALAQRAAVRGPVQRQFYGAEDVPADQRAEVQKFRAGIDPLNVEPGILNQPQEIIPTTPTGGNQQAIIAQMEQERFREGTPMSAPERFAQGLVNAPLQTARSAVGLVTDPLASAVAPRQVLDAKDRSDAAYEAQYGPRGFAGRLGAGVGQVAVAAPLAAAGGLGAGAGVLAASSAEQGYQDYLQNVGRDRASIAKALSVGGLYGAAEYVAERIGLGAILRETGTRGGLEAVKGALRAAGVNASEEALTQVAQNAISKYSYDPGRSLTEGAGEAGLIGGVAGGVAHGAMHAGGEHQATWADMEQLKATTPAPIGRGTTAQVPDGAGPPAQRSTEPSRAESVAQPSAVDIRRAPEAPPESAPLPRAEPKSPETQSAPGAAPSAAESPRIDAAREVEASSPELYPRARQILDELGVPDSGEVADRLGITLPEADRLVGRWEEEGRTPAPATGDTPEGTAAQDAGSSDVAGRSPESSRDVPSQKERPSPNSTRPALGSSRLGIPLDVVSEATRQREAAAENIARQSRPFAPPGRAAETERRSVLNRFRNPDTAGYSTEGSLTPEGVFADAEARAARRTPPVPDKSASPAAADAAQESGRSPRAFDTARPAMEASRSSGEGTREAKQPWEMTAFDMAKADPKYAAQDARVTKMRESISGSRWGETRRFAGRSAGIRLDNIAKAEGVRDRTYDRIKAQHRATIEQALSEGRPVPAAVLADYPDLKQSGKLGEQSGKPSTLSKSAVPESAASRSSGEGTREAKQPWEMTRDEIDAGGDIAAVKQNLKDAGTELRANGVGHMVMPDGTGLAPTSSRGIANHWEAAVDAGYLPKSELTKLTHSPTEIVNGLLKKGWTRFKGAGQYEVWKLDASQRKSIEQAAAHEAKFGTDKTWYVDETGAGRAYSFKLQDLVDNNFNLAKTLRSADVQTYAPGVALDLDRVRVETALSEGRPVPAEVLKDYPELGGGNKPETNAPEKLPTREQVTNLDKSWLGRTLYAWRDRLNVQLRKGDRAKSDLGNRSVRGMTVRQRADFTTIPTDATRLVQWISDRTPEVWKLEGTAGRGWTMVPKKLVEKAKAAVPDWEADVEFHAKRKAARMDKIWENRRKRMEAEQAKQTAAAEAAKKAEIEHARKMTPEEWDALSEKNPAHAERLAVMLEAEESANASPVPEWTIPEADTIAEDLAGRPGAEEAPAEQGRADQTGGESGGEPRSRASENRGLFGQHTEGLTGRQPDLLDVAPDPAAAIERPGIRPNETPAQYDKRMGTADTSLLGGIAEYAAKRAAELKAAPDIRQAGKGFKGKGGRAGAGNLQAAIGWAAWKAVERGAQGLEKVRITVEHAVEAFKRFGIEHTPDKAREFVRAVNRMLAASENKDGTASAHKLEALLADARQSASADVREGMAKRGEQTTARRKLTEQGQKHLDEMRAKREDFADQLDALKAKHDLGQDVRRELVSAAKRYLDPADQGKVLPFIASARAKDPTAKNPDMARDWYAGLRKILDIADESAAKKARAKLLATAGGPERAPRTQTLRNIIDRNLGVLPHKTELSRGVIEPDKLLPHNRDAVAPLVGDLRKTFVLGKNIDTFADHLEERAGALGSGWLDDAKLAQLKAIGTKSLADLTTDQATLLTDALHHLEHLNKVERTAFIGGKETDRAAMHDTINAQLEDRYRIDRKDDKKVRAVTRAARNVKTFLGEQHRGFGHLIGTAFGEDGPAYKALYEGPHRGESEGMGLAEESKDALRKTLIKHDVTESTVARMRQDKHTIKLPGGGTIELTSAERIDVAGLWSDPKNKKLIENNGLKFEEHDGVKGHELRLAPADLDAITESMTPVERDTLAEFKKQTNGPLAKAVNEASVRSDGFEIATNPDHYSRKVDSYGMDRNRKGGGTIIRRWLEDMGILKPRTEHSRALLIRDFFSFADAHIDKMARYAKMAEPIRDALIALGDPTIRSTLIRKFGRDFVTRLEDHYEYVSGTGKHATPADEELIRKITGLGAVYTLWGRLTSAALQNVGFLSASVDSKTAGEAWRISRHLADLRPTSDDAAYHDLIKHSGALRVRHEHGPTRLVDFTKGETRSGIGSQLTTNVVEVGLKPLSVRDKFVSVNLFKEIRETVKGEHPNWTKDQIDEEAAIRTERRVGRTQNPSQRMDRSQMEREADTNARKAAALLFSSAGVRVGNMIQARIYEAVKNPTRANKARAAWALAAAVIGASAAEGVRELWRKAKAGFQEEPRGRDMTQHGVNVAADLANNFVPGSGDIVKLSAAKIRHRPANFDTGSLSGQIVGGASVAYDLATILFSGDENAAGKAWERLKKAGGGFAPLDIAKGVHRMVTDSD